LIEHWQWENVYEVLPAAAWMELSWIILYCISSFENYINSAGSVVLNAFEKALNYYTLGQNPLFQIMHGKKAVTDYNALTEHLVSTKKCGKGKAEEEKSPSTIKHKAELALQKKSSTYSTSTTAPQLTACL
ncbi:uncharacterized protein ACA1_299690, partial [Acanthamoeba castellanii str. Neff]